MDKAGRIAALRQQMAKIESELTATGRDLPEDSNSAPAEVERYQGLEARYQELRDELAGLRSPDLQ